MEILKELPPLTGGRIFDTHSHYSDDRFNEDRDLLLRELHRYGVSGIITCAVDERTSRAAVEIAHRHDFVYAAVGLHPEDLDGINNTDWVAPMCRDEKVVAVGEIGLDYHYEGYDREEQIKVFERQLDIANEVGLPAIIHDRDAHEDTFEIVRRRRPTGVMHCYSGSGEMARQLANLGLYIGVGGVVTFKNARKTVEAVEAVPLEMMLLETDCPFLSPTPYRGKRNHSALIYFVAERVAQIKNVSVSDVLRQTELNAKRLFTRCK